MSERIVLPDSLAGERLDRAVALVLERSRTEVSEMIAAGAISVGGEVVRRGHRRLSAGEVLEIEIDDRAKPTPSAGVRPSEIAFRVVFVDESIIVVDKPAGLVVHPGAGHHDDTLVSGLVSRYPDLVAAGAAGAGDPARPGIVHRLDKDTSGLLVVARTPKAYRALSLQLETRTMGRRYLALALGDLPNDEGVIEAPIGRSRRDRTRMAVSVTGREARTRYRVSERYVEPISASLLEVHLDTGRTHQIRVHLKAIGHPIAGDARYGGRVGRLSLTRPFLHAATISLVHPETEEALSFESPLPDDLVSVLGELTARPRRD